MADTGDLRTDLVACIARYGGAPCASSTLGKRIADSDESYDELLRDCPVLAAPTINRAVAFTSAVSSGQQLEPFAAWSKYIRLRVGLCGSELSRMLARAIEERGRPQKRSLGVASQTSRGRQRSQYDQVVSTSSATAVVQQPLAPATQGVAVGTPDVGPAELRQQRLAEAVTVNSAAIPYTPQFVADWLYQGLLDTVSCFE